MKKSTKTPAPKVSQQKAPSSACSLAEIHSDGSLFQFKDAEGETAKMDMVAYSGGTIPNHWYWGNLAINLDGMKFPGSKFPILSDHETDQRIGFSKKPLIENGALMIRDVTFLETSFAEEFIRDSKAGFPFQASIRATPTKVTRLREDEVAMVNGKEVKGPGSIWESSIFKEASVCVFGYDPNTASAAMSEEPGEFAFALSGEEEPTTEREEPKMVLTAEMFREENPDEYDKLTKDIAAQTEQKFADQLKAKEDEATALKAQNGEQGKVIKEMVSFMEKAHEKEMASTALSIVNSALSSQEALSLPQRMKDRIKTQFSKEYGEHIKEDVLDETAFSAAVLAEVKECAEMFKDMKPKTSILGSGGMGKEPTAMSSDDEDVILADASVKASLDRMRKIIGNTEEAE